MESISLNLAWWITAFDLPAMAGLLLFIWRTRRDCESAVENVQENLDRRSDQLRDALSAFKLEVAKTYAAQTDLRELESRLTAHLLRIESKLDATALKAEAASVKK